MIAAKMKFFVRPWMERVKSVVKNGHMFAYEDWYEMVRWFANDMTFEEAYKKTGRVFCITLASTTKKAPPVLINYNSAPNVTIASAVVASAAVPGFIP
jgi:predicted acylesterase/phospholipase RssA